jgi:hypothetical protein
MAERAFMLNLLVGAGGMADRPHRQWMRPEASKADKAVARILLMG